MKLNYEKWWPPLWGWLFESTNKEIEFDNELENCKVYETE